MALLGRKNTETPGQNLNALGNKIHSIKVLGMGCKSCHAQFKNVKAAITELGLNIEVEYITDMEEVLKYGVMTMPAIVLNEKVIAMGKVYSTKDVIEILNEKGDM